MRNEVGDVELLCLLREGSAKGYELLIRRYDRLLFRTARAILVDDAEAQDAVQETYLRAFTRLSSFRGDASLRTWLSRVVINQALERRRKAGRVIFWDEDVHMDHSDMASSIADSLAAQSSKSPENEAARKELCMQLKRAIDLLPPIYRYVFILRAVQELNVKQTSVALAISADVVKTRYLRARGMLRTSIRNSDRTSSASGSHCDILTGWRGEP